MANSDAKLPSFFLSYRFMLALIGFFAYALQYLQKTNMSVAIVCMINQTELSQRDHMVLLADNTSSVLIRDKALIYNTSSISADTSSSKCGYESSSSQTAKDGEFGWSKSTQGMVLSSYFYGYLITEIPGGFLSLKYGSKLVLAFSILVSSIFTIVLPFMARYHHYGLAAGRFIVGCAHGVVWPAFAGFWGSWAPASDRSRLIGTANAGSQIGNVVAFSLGGYLCENGFDGGWPSIFYIFGIVGVVWFVVWMILASNGPEENRFIGEAEKIYVLEETKEIRSALADSEANTPWCKIMCSKAVIAVIVGHSCSNWGTYLFLTSLPTYMKEVLKFDIKKNGLLSSIPYLVFWLFITLSGIIGDTLIQKWKMSKTKVRRIFNTVGFLMPMAAVIGLSFVTCESKYIGVALLTVGLAFTGCTYGAGFMVNYNDIAGSYSGIVFGIGNTFATLPGILAPYLVGAITKNQLQEEWRIVFYITAAVYLVGAIALFVLTSGEMQPWAARAKITASGVSGSGDNSKSTDMILTEL